MLTYHPPTLSTLPRQAAHHSGVRPSSSPTSTSTLGSCHTSPPSPKAHTLLSQRPYIHASSSSPPASTVHAQATRQFTPPPYLQQPTDYFRVILPRRLAPSTSMQVVWRVVKSFGVVSQVRRGSAGLNTLYDYAESWFSVSKSSLSYNL